MRLGGMILAVVAAASLLWRAPDTYAQPRLSLISPEDGDVLAEPPTRIHMCFASPVNVRDLDKGGDFRFNVFTPDGRGLGLRIVFQPDGFGVDVYPGIPQGEVEGSWRFEWRVTDPDNLEPTVGTIEFTVSPGGSPAPQETAQLCTGPGTPPPLTTPTPASIGENGGDGGPDIRLLTVITASSVGGAAFLALIVLRVSRRLRRPGS